MRYETSSGSEIGYKIKNNSKKFWTPKFSVVSSASFYFLRLKKSNSKKFKTPKYILIENHKDIYPIASSVRIIEFGL